MVLNGRAKKQESKTIIIIHLNSETLQMKHKSKNAGVTKIIKLNSQKYESPFWFLTVHLSRVNLSSSRVLTVYLLAAGISDQFFRKARCELALI